MGSCKYRAQACVLKDRNDDYRQALTDFRKDLGAAVESGDIDGRSNRVVSMLLDDHFGPLERKAAERR